MKSPEWRVEMIARCQAQQAKNDAPTITPQAFIRELAGRCGSPARYLA